MLLITKLSEVTAMSKLFRPLKAGLIYLIVTLVGWLLLTIGNVAIAQPSSNAATPIDADTSTLIHPELDPDNIPSTKVSQFVHAYLQVVALIDRREGELQGAETESESIQIEREIEAAALAMIEQAGLTRQEYLQLLGLANTDPEFGERVALQVQEAAR
ncbi:DUF4168 domain-containing protein [Pantanalinema rosaneae CENA516]|uniref:DUF4168 domain-containing protein n=1 Tax=Pantanalinema rosaneae TaxID=1620701 RepID=UPI003D6EE1D1